MYKKVKQRQICLIFEQQWNVMLGQIQYPHRDKSWHLSLKKDCMAQKRIKESTVLWLGHHIFVFNQ